VIFSIGGRRRRISVFGAVVPVRVLQHDLVGRIQSVRRMMRGEITENA
jgi:hypothetical protein